ncbi:unnamed protein product [Protopolystoma xenopodis]|uniref:Uncharacterized protein n=1 Tax=Protopolystoma xenopodis TaxID=117903 RepID=A0A3S5CMB5_9PLAT|nr:unnamed protein product [Protopolystoma xenopodis]
MLADVSSVESLYNVAVDLARLNSQQVRALLEAYQPFSRIAKPDPAKTPQRRHSPCFVDGFYGSDQDADGLDAAVAFTDDDYLADDSK